MVNPPAAKPTPHKMSKPIHKPQGNLSLKLVDAPNPLEKRIIVAIIPKIQITTKAPFQKVNLNGNLIFLSIFYVLYPLV